MSTWTGYGVLIWKTFGPKEDPERHYGPILAPLGLAPTEEEATRLAEIYGRSAPSQVVHFESGLIAGFGATFEPTPEEAEEEMRYWQEQER